MIFVTTAFVGRCKSRKWNFISLHIHVEDHVGSHLKRKRKRKHPVAHIHALSNVIQVLAHLAQQWLHPNLVHVGKQQLQGDVPIINQLNHVDSAVRSLSDVDAIIVIKSAMKAYVVLARF
jgi:hypothetical protein